MSNTKIVVIGAGSLAFTSNFLAEVISSEDLKGSTVALVDIDPEKLELMTTLANRMVEERRSDVEIQSSIDRREVLKDADFVIATIAVGGADASDLDGDIPLKYGIYQSIADTVGPGGFFRALRHIPPMIEIARDIEKLSPDAIFFNETNPMTCICTAVRRVTNVNIIGLCSGIAGIKRYIARFLEVDSKDIKIIAAGINHLTWILDLRLRGEDAYPLLREKWEEAKKEIAATGKLKGQPFTYSINFRLFEIYGVFPSPGGGHIAEFYPYFFLTKEADGGKKYGLKQYPEGTIYERKWRNAMYDKIVNLAKLGFPLDDLFGEKREGEKSFAVEMISTLVRKESTIFEAVNIPNEGFVTNLPKGAIVEVPAIIGPSGIRGIYVGDLPKSVASTIQQRLMQQELTVDAALTGDRNIALQALMADHYVPSIEVAEKVLDELLKAQAQYLPQFK